MAKIVIDIPMNMKKAGQKISHPRRFSTGNSIIKLAEPTPVPNYLRASIGSCHDFCKYGTKHDIKPKSTRPPLSPKHDHDNVKITLLEEKSSDKKHKVKKILSASATKLLQEPTKGKKAAPRTFLKGSSNIRARLNGAEDVIRAPKTSKKTTSLPPARSFLTGSSIKAQIPKSRTSKSILPKRLVVPQLKTIKKHIEKSKTQTKTSSYENVPEKIIHVEQKDKKIPNVDLKVESSRSITTTRGGKVIVSEENDSSPRKLKFRRGKVLEVRNGNEGSMTHKSLRRVGSDRDFIHKKNDSVKGSLHHQGMERKMTNTGLYNIVIEETASKLVKMRKSKVEALVGAFETVIKIHDYESLRTSSTY